MLNLLAATLLAVAPAATQQPATDTPQVEVPSPALVEEATEALTEAFKKGKTPERLEALEKYGEVNDAKVIGYIAKGLRDKHPEVRFAAVDALRWLENPAALAELHKAFKKDKAIKKNDELYEAFVWAIGQHGDPKSIDVLLDGALASAPRKVQVARIYSLGHIRDAASVDELIGILRKTGSGRRGGKGGGRGGGQPMMQEISISLEVLTGQDFRKDEAAWAKWWRANEKGYKVTPEPQRLSKKTAKAWKKRWEKPKEKDAEDGDSRRRRRHDGVD